MLMLILMLILMLMLMLNKCINVLFAFTIYYAVILLL